MAWRAASGHGAPSNRRSVVDLGNGRSAFVKIAAYDYRAGWLRDELRIYSALDGQPFLPRNAEIDGNSLLHYDVRSDNLCLQEGTAVLVDWNSACVGNPVLDTASWLPSLEAEGGPAPHVILPDETPGMPAIASLLAGYFCARAGLPAIPQAPHARPLQLMRSKTALPWAARLLDLPPPA